MLISDWSSDVCSSDLSTQLVSAAFGQPFNVVQQPQGQPKTVRNKRLPAAIIHALRAMPVKQFAGHVGGINPTAVLILYLVQAAFAASVAQDRKSKRLNSSH